MERERKRDGDREERGWYSHYGKQYKDSAKIISRTTILSSNLLLGIYPKEMKPLSWRDICTPLFIVAFTVARIWKHASCVHHG